MPEFSYRAAAVDRGRVIQLLRHALQSGQEDQHRVAPHRRPHIDHRDRGQRAVARRQPTRRIGDADSAQEFVYRPNTRGQQKGPNNSQCHRGDQMRYEEKCAE